MAGCDILDLSLARLLSVIYTAVTQNMDDEQRHTLDMRLFPPDPETWGTGPEAEAGMAATMALLGEDPDT